VAPLAYATTRRHFHYGSTRILQQTSGLEGAVDLSLHMEAHGGRLWASADVPRGTVF